jgi:hypothetical protein
LLLLLLRQLLLVELLVVTAGLVRLGVEMLEVAWNPATTLRGNHFQKPQ